MLLVRIHGNAPLMSNSALKENRMIILEKADRSCISVDLDKKKRIKRENVNKNGTDKLY